MLVEWLIRRIGSVVGREVQNGFLLRERVESQFVRMTNYNEALAPLVLVLLIAGGTTFLAVMGASAMQWQELALFAGIMSAFCIWPFVLAVRKVWSITIDSEIRVRRLLGCQKYSVDQLKEAWFGLGDPIGVFHFRFTDGVELDRPMTPENARVVENALHRLRQLQKHQITRDA